MKYSVWFTFTELRKGAAYVGQRRTLGDASATVGSQF